ncbi:MAG: type II toxin-antitoxin system VapC family toxin [Rickettsia endosymbiont of Culicoides impunctatus]|nr:MAG: type II toxin-antitoxin system VapC family toxin [Rickettsia endosymbiont of Culicoides impunctatus]
MRYILDTNILSELKRKIPNTKVLAWINQIPTELLYISCISVGEIKKGILKKAKTDISTALILENWLEDILISYSNKILNIDLVVCQKWAELLIIDGTNDIDSQLAAQAIVHDMVLVTRNTKHFNKFGVKLLNPFEEFGFK